MQLKGEELPGFDAHKVAMTAWQSEIDAANGQYEPGKFTTLIGYEWTSMADGKYNLHRNVLFAGDKAPFPFTADQSKRPEDLWTWLESQRRRGMTCSRSPITRMRAAASCSAKKTATAGLSTRRMRCAGCSMSR